MTITRTTLLDIAKANGSEALNGLIEEVIPAVPELQFFGARPIKGLSFKTLVRTGLPTVGFRNANQGTAAVKSTYANRTYETFIMNPRIECDAAVADSYEDGAAAWMAIEGTGVTAAAGITVAKQIYYGSAAGAGGDTKGFPGLLGIYDSDNLVVDATGTTASTGSSVWAVKFGVQNCQLVVGLNGQLTLSDVRLETIYDADNNPLDGYVQTLLARIGLQVSSKYSVGRIKKLTADNGKGLTDNLLSQLYEKFPIGHKPDAFFMSRRSQGQLQRSRTATNSTGAPAPMPTEWQGIPLIPTDSILDTEPLTL
jgi:hypothetical protein